MFKKINEAIDWLITRKKDNKRYNLNDMSDCLMSLGIKDDDLKVIHIGGTNGKGSTCATLTNILIQAGYKVGRYISPYVVEFNERISINNKYIKDKKLLEYINFIYIFNEEFSKTHDSLSFFELTTLIAIKYFKDEGCDYCVFEVGIGGRLDATNVLKPLVSAITNVQKDHMKQLGNSLAKILNEKLGIVKEGVPFVTPINKKALVEKVVSKTEELNAPLYLLEKPKRIKVSLKGTKFRFEGKRYFTSLIGVHQATNMTVVIKICQILNEKYGLNISDKNIKTGLKKVKWPGRFEIIDDFILDGGHNTQGIQAIHKTLDQLKLDHICCVFCAMQDKEVQKMVCEIEKFSEFVIYTMINYYRSGKNETFVNFSSNGNYICTIHVNEAIEKAKEAKENGYNVIFLGSLYFISEVRKILLGGK